MARLITISDSGGLSGFGSVSMMDDTAEVLLEALAEVLGVEVRWYNSLEVGPTPAPQDYAECGTVTVEAREW